MGAELRLHRAQVGQAFFRAEEEAVPFAFPDRSVHGKVDLARQDRRRVYDE
jgi:hypothetical protein